MTAKRELYDDLNEYPLEYSHHMMGLEQNLCSAIDALCVRFFHETRAQLRRKGVTDETVDSAMPPVDRAIADAARELKGKVGEFAALARWHYPGRRKQLRRNDAAIAQCLANKQAQ